MMNKIEVTVDEQRVRVVAPYHEVFAGRARGRQGQASKAVDGRYVYSFERRDEQWAREQCIEVYGTDDSSTAEVLTIRADLEKLRASGKQQLWLAGRSVAHRWDRDSSVKLGPGCVVISGSFRGSGGSRKNPAIDACDGIVVEIRDVPRGLALLTVEKSDGAVTLVDDDGALLNEVPPPNPLARASDEAFLEEVRRRGISPLDDVPEDLLVAELGRRGLPLARHMPDDILVAEVRSRGLWPVADVDAAPSNGAKGTATPAKARKAKARAPKAKAPTKGGKAKAPAPKVKAPSKARKPSAPPPKVKAAPKARQANGAPSKAKATTKTGRTKAAPPKAAKARTKASSKKTRRRE